MKYDIPITSDIIIPGHELTITTSKSGGPGGQHANKTDTRVTVRWNIQTTSALTEEQRIRVTRKLQPFLTEAGELIIHSSVSRSQLQNKKQALQILADKIRTSLYVAKQRKKTKIPTPVKEAIMRVKAHRSALKKTRSTRDYDE